MSARKQRLNKITKAGLFLFCLAGLLRLLLLVTPRLPATVMEGAIGFLYGLSVVLLIGGFSTGNKNSRCSLEANSPEAQQ